MFTEWKQPKMTLVWVARKYHAIDQQPKHEPDFFGAKHISTKSSHMHPGHDFSNCVEVGPGLWRDKICHFLPDAPPGSGDNETHSEYFIDYDKFYEALQAIYGIRDKFLHLLHSSEFRLVCPDLLPLSPAKGRRAVIIHFTWYRMHSEVFAVLPEIEKVLIPFNPKPHYGKHIFINFTALTMVSSKASLERTLSP